VVARVVPVPVVAPVQHGLEAGAVVALPVVVICKFVSLLHL
jgi:hypothetical protein